jgi:hypothetical protein
VVKKIIYYLVAVLVFVGFSIQPVLAIDIIDTRVCEEQKETGKPAAYKNAFNANDIIFFDPCDELVCSTTSVSTSIASSEVLSFAHQPINSTWGIDDSTAEQWFLQAIPCKVSQYGLNSDNIKEVTAAIKAAGVSPAFFYAYSVTEGCSQGNGDGFINHYASGYYANNGGNTAINAATGDAQYLAKIAQDTSTNPAWVDAGNPVYTPAQDVMDAGNADFQSMPAGTIGRAFIPSTAAATWEVYIPEALSGAVNNVQDYGPPLSRVMESIIAMGGDLSNTSTIGSSGGSSAGCSTSNSGSSALSGSIAQVAEEMGAWGAEYQACYVFGGGHGWTQEQMDTAIENHFTGEYGVDCSGFVSAVIYKATGIYRVWNTNSMCDDTANFQVVTDPQPGDFAINCSAHVAVIVGVNSDGSFNTIDSSTTGCGAGMGPSPSNYTGDMVLRYIGEGA